MVVAPGVWSDIYGCLVGNMSPYSDRTVASGVVVVVVGVCKL